MFKKNEDKSATEEKNTNDEKKPVVEEENVAKEPTKEPAKDAAKVAPPIVIKEVTADIQEPPIVEVPVGNNKHKTVKVQVLKTFTDLFIVKGRFSGAKDEERMYPDYAVPHLRRNGYVI